VTEKAEERDRLRKVLTLAMHPETIPEEALAAFNRARKIVESNPALAHPPEPRKPAPPPPRATFKATITSVHPDWILVVVGNLSGRAYDLGLKSKITFDFLQTPPAINVLCEGSQNACSEFEKHATWFTGHVNKQIAGTQKRKR
jgi:hypothetical protein